MLLQLQNISKGYGIPGTHSFRPVLECLSFEMEKGEKIAIVGQSGSGKTTLLNLIGALDIPDSGKILFDNMDITGYSKENLANFRNQSIGFVFQMHHLLPQLTVWENVLLPLLHRHSKISDKHKEWAGYLIKKVGIWEQRNQKPAQLSGGECQRTAVVRALINKPKLILADEPTGALDETNSSIISDLLLNLSGEEKTALLVVTHSGLLSAKMEKTYTLRNGQLINT